MAQKSRWQRVVHAHNHHQGIHKYAAKPGVTFLAVFGNLVVLRNINEILLNFNIPKIVIRKICVTVVIPKN